MGEFQGWLLKKNGIIFPTSYIFKDGYKVTPNIQTDIDSYADETGLLHRNVLPHTSTKIEFNLKPMRLREMNVAKAFFIPRTVVTFEYWNDEDTDYKPGDFYVPDIVYEYYYVDTEGKDIFYKSTRIALIEY